MTQESTKAALKLAIEQRQRCISLIGGWGYGKSFLLNETLKELDKPRVEISLFGIGSVEELRNTLTTDIAIYKADLKNQEIRNKYSSFRNLFSRFKKTKNSKNINWKKHLKEFASNHFSGLLSASTNLIVQLVDSDMVFVFEDIERSNTINLGDFLGLVESLKNNSQATIILVLNDSELKEKDIWANFREKILDREIPLDIKSEEATKLASRYCPAPLLDTFNHVSKVLNIRNIRALEKMAKDLTNIFELMGMEYDADLNPIYCSCLLFSALHWRLTSEKIDMVQFLELEATLYDFENEDTDRELADMKNKWSKNLRAFSIGVLDEFEKVILFNFYSRGHFDKLAFERYIRDYKLSEARRQFESKFQDYFTRYSWDQSVSKAELLRELKELVLGCYHLSPRHVSDLIYHSESYFKDNKLSKKIIEVWTNNASDKLNIIDESTPISNKFHPDIFDFLQAAKDQHLESLTLLKALILLSENSGFSNEVKNVIENATKRDFIEVLEAASQNELRCIVQAMHPYLEDRVKGHSFEKAVTAYRGAIDVLRVKTGRLSDILNHQY
jgi:KAP-like P-loop domain-containing protein